MMPITKIHRRVLEERNRLNRSRKLAETTSSLDGRSSEVIGDVLIGPRTVPDLLSGRVVGSVLPEGRAKLTKLLLNVTVQRSLGAVQVLMSPQSTVDDLIAAALRQYAKEGRRPIFSSTDPSGFDLHYSQFSLESIAPGETLMELGSRNFFLCWKNSAPAAETGGSRVATPSSRSSCSRQAEKANMIGLPWFKFLF